MKVLIFENNILTQSKEPSDAAFGEFLHHSDNKRGSKTFEQYPLSFTGTNTCTTDFFIARILPNSARWLVKTTYP